MVISFALKIQNVVLNGVLIGTVRFCSGHERILIAVHVGEFGENYLFETVSSPFFVFAKELT
jgi:hypothetical protein